MKKFAISAAVLVGITVLAVLVLNVSECRKSSPNPVPDAAVTAPPSTVVPVPTDSGVALNAYVLVQTAESGTVKSVPGGKYLLSLSGIKDSVQSEDGHRTMNLDSYVELIFGGSRTAKGMLDYDGSRGPVEVRLSSPSHFVADGGPIHMSYEMEVVGGKQVLAKFGKASLRVKPPP